MPVARSPLPLLLRTRGRFGVSLLLGVLVGTLYPGPLGWAVRTELAWNVGASCLLAIVWLFVAESDAAQTRRRAGAADPGRTAVALVVVAGCLFSLVAALLLVRQRHGVAPGHPGLLLGLCVWSALCAWFLTHSMFTLRYAHLYYADGSSPGGLQFPEQHPPDDLDFAYFAFTVGMCFQVSDVAVTLHRLRRTVLAHAVLSFFFNTTLLAFAVNLLFGHLG